MLFPFLINSFHLDKKTEITISNETFSDLASNTILINEASAVNPEWVELINRGQDRNMTGWTLRMFRQTGTSFTYTFPDNFIFMGSSLIRIIDTTGSNTPTVLYTGGGCNWLQGSPNMASLLDAGGSSVDHVQWNSYSGAVPPDADWSGDISSGGNNVIYRITDYDTDSASDWAFTSDAASTPLALNPGQSFLIWQVLLSIDLITDDSLLLTDVEVPSSVRTGKALTITCKVSTQTPVDAVKAFIQHTDGYIIAVLDLFDDGTHHDNNVNDSIFGGIWDTSKKPLDFYYLDIIIKNTKGQGKLYDNIAQFSIKDTFLSQNGWLIGLIIGIAVLAIEGVMLVIYRPRGLFTQMKNFQRKVVPKWKKIWEKPPSTQRILHHRSGERPYDLGISINTCPYCNQTLPASTVKQLELGYRVYCPKPGCYHPLHES